MSKLLTFASMEYKRAYFQTIKNRTIAPRMFIQAITGPRQVGKTTLINQLCDEINFPYSYISADNVANASGIWLEQQWENARLKLRSSPQSGFLLIIDEIQKINNWSDTVKQLWDADTFNKTNLKIILLGSSGLMLQQGLNESLAGRFELIKVPHWSFKEMNACFGIDAEQFAWFGGYPGSVFLMKDDKRWRDYVKNALIESTISKDILLLTRISKPALMRQVFEMGVSYSSQILSFNKMMGQLQDAGNTTTIAHYLQLLDTSGLLSGIPKFFIEEFRIKSSSPKWQVKNTALISAMSQQSYQETRSNFAKWGQVVESAIGAHLINKADEGNYKVFYWRHRNYEVDFVIKKGDKIIGIEVKSGKTKPTKGMDEFRRKFKPTKVLLVGTSGLLWKDFLLMEPAELF